MKPLIFIAIGLVLGFVISQFFQTPEIKEVKVVEYKTKWRVKPDKIKKLTLKQAIGHVNSSIIIDHKIEDNWMSIRAYDSIKESRTDIKLQCSEGYGFKTYAIIGGLIVTGILAGSIFL